MLAKDTKNTPGPKTTTRLYVEYRYDDRVVNTLFHQGHASEGGAVSERPPGALQYGADGSGDVLSRWTDQGRQQRRPGRHAIAYTYLGLNTIVVEDYAEPQVRLDYWAGTSGVYQGFDAFGPRVDQQWQKYDGLNGNAHRPLPVRLRPRREPAVPRERRPDGQGRDLHLRRRVIG